LIWEKITNFFAYTSYHAIGVLYRHFFFTHTKSPLVLYVLNNVMTN